MLAREFRGHRLPDGLVKTTNKEVSVAGRDLENLEVLKQKALAHKRISADTWALVLPKAKPYAPGAGFDNMLFVAKEHTHVGNIGELSPQHLSEIFSMAEGVKEVYREQADADNPIVLETVAINFHEDPVPEKTFGKKLHAQTLKDLHVHVVGFQEQDVADAAPLERNTVSKQEWRDLHDPFVALTEMLWKLPGVRNALLEGVRHLQPEDEVIMPGMTFTVDADTLSSVGVANDLIQLHRNYLLLHDRFSGLFVDTSKQDSTGMPVLWEKNERDRRIEEFVREQAGGVEVEDELLRRAHTWLRRTSRLMRSGENVQADASHPDEKIVFLRGPAYTLSILRQPGSKQAIVNLSPRVLSSGNFLASLRLHKVVSGEVSPAWLAKRKTTEEAITTHFRAEATSAAA